MRTLLTGMAMFLAMAGAPVEVDESVKSVHEFSLKGIDGGEVSLSEYKGKVAMLVNVASKCGFTDQYEGLQKLYEKYRDKGFVILGFPANNFLGQEPGSEEEIKQFCTVNFGVTFPMFSKISVKGKDIDPLYAFLTSKKTNPEFGGAISWNFNKFLVDGEGRVIARFGSRTKPLDEEVVKAVEKALETSSR